MSNQSSGVQGCFTIIFIVFVLALFTNSCNLSKNTSEDKEIDHIIQAKEYVLSQLNYPDTADFHELDTKVTSTNVYLKVTVKNGFGVPSTLEFNVPRSALR